MACSILTVRCHALLSARRSNITDFLYRNLESVLCLITAALYITIAASRVQAGEGFECSATYLHIEKNATAVTLAAAHISSIYVAPPCASADARLVGRFFWQISAVFLFSNLLLLMKPSRVLGQFSMIL